MPLQRPPWETVLAAPPCRLLPAGSLAALVSDVPPGPVAQTRRNMVAHTSVLERAIARTDVLPLRFGTVAPDADRLRPLRRRQRQPLRHRLARHRRPG